MNRHILIVLIVFLCGLFPSATYGQETDKNIFDKIKNFGKTLQEKNTLDNMLKKAKKTSGTPSEVNILNSIRSPFEPQIPKEKIVPVTPQPKPIPKPKVMPQPKQPDIPKPEVPLPSFQVNGLVWNTERPQAILDSQVINVGDTIKGCTVINIDKNGVLLNFQDRTFTVQP